MSIPHIVWGYHIIIFFDLVYDNILDTSYTRLLALKLGRACALIIRLLINTLKYMLIHTCTR